MTGVVRVRAAPAASEVVVLTQSNFDSEIAKNDATLVEFYAPWCGHCKALAPEYDRASVMLQGQGVLGKVDCTAHRELCSKYEVQGFPTVKLFRNDGSEPTDYDQARKAEAIVKFMQKQRAPAYTTAATAAELDAAKAKADLVVVGFVAEGDNAGKEEFVAVAKVLRNEYDFVLVQNDQLAQDNGVSSRPGAVIFRKFDEPTVVFGGAFNRDELADWVYAEAFPLLGTIGPENYQKYLERGLPLMWIFVNYDKEKDVLETAKTVAKDHKKDISFVQLDGVRWADHAKTLGLNGKTPGIVIEDRETRKHYVLPQDAPVTAEALRGLIQGYLAKTLQPTLKSEAEPADNSGPVKVVVGKSFDKIVLDNSKDVLVEFYAPWCGHCKSLAPKYEQLGAQFKESPSVVIAKVDATENDTPADIKGFPTLIFYPAGAKDEPVTYDGDRTVEAMAAFIREHATTLQAGGAADSSKDEL